MLRWAAGESVRGRAIERFCRLHESFGKRRMRVHRFRKVARGGADLDGEYAFADQDAGTGAGNTDAENSFRFRFNNEFGQAVGTVERERAAGGAPKEFADFDFDVLCFGFGFRKAAPGD